jgi:hypothetical protein
MDGNEGLLNLFSDGLCVENAEMGGNIAHFVGNWCEKGFGDGVVNRG